MNACYRVELSAAECSELTALLRGGRYAARTLKRAQILLAAGAGESEAIIARHVAVSAPTMCRTKRRFVEGNLERALSEDLRPGRRAHPLNVHDRQSPDQDGPCLSPASLSRWIGQTVIIFVKRY
jgi:hypothetical protein